MDDELEGGGALLHDLAEEVGLVFEVVVDEAGGIDVGGAGDVLVGGFLEALAGEHLECAINDLLAAGFVVLFVSWGQLLYLVMVD